MESYPVLLLTEKGSWGREAGRGRRGERGRGGEGEGEEGGRER